MSLKCYQTLKELQKKKAISIAEEFIANWEIWQLVGFLDKFGVGPQKRRKKFIKHWEQMQ